MRKLIYHVATSIDNFIAHEDGSAEAGFIAEGEHVDEYLEQLQAYDTVIMGRRTYEYGYRFGLKPGEVPYPSMKNYVFSKSIKIEKTDDRLQIVKKDEIEFVKQLKVEDGTDIYLCGGGEFAGSLLQHELIDELLIKYYPVIFGKGIPLFGDNSKPVKLGLIRETVYSTGVILLRYQLNYYTD